MRRNARAWRWVAAALAIPAGYVVAGAIGGALPVNRDWTPPREGVRIYVEDNGIHTGLVLPVAAAGVDLADLSPAAVLRDPRYAGHRWRSYGWGDRDFYVDTPTWADLSPRTVLRAGIGSETTVMHVDFIPEPQVGDGVRSVVLRPHEYRRLAAFVRASFAAGAGGAAMPGYAAYDAFYPATGRYSAARTCNAWTGEALAFAGMRVGRWTPFPSTVMRWLPTT